MSKDNYILFLQAALLAWDGGNPTAYGIGEPLATMGIKLSDYCKKLEVSA